MLAKNGQSTINKILAVALLGLSLCMLTACQPQKQERRQPKSTPGFLTITGNGVQNQTTFSLTELKEMEADRAEACYSVINNWPAKKFVVGRGVEISHLLEKAGIKDDAQTIIIWADDGYNAAFTRDQLEEKRYCFPNLLKKSEEGAEEVPAILAWEHHEGTDDISKASSGKLKLLIGQKGLNDVVAPVCVKDVVSLEVLTASLDQWDIIKAEPLPGKVKPGAKVILNHPEQDLVKIFYTLDGSTPNENSCVYNPSTSYFQPELTQAIEVNESLTIKAIAIGFGKNNSPVAIFNYEVE